jgi:hypothetical protein
MSVKYDTYRHVSAAASLEALGLDAVHTPPEVPVVALLLRTVHAVVVDHEPVVDEQLGAVAALGANAVETTPPHLFGMCVCGF